ncbi:MAG: META domain-containing protein [Euryarchaeota archaeon]|nr:META domain-containing protein [Euryarchaeota archaeon]
MPNRSTPTILVMVAVFAVCGLGASVEPLYTDNNTASNASSGNLYETEWILTSLNGNSLVKESRITIAFAARMVTGFAGCNHYGGEYTMTDNGTLTIPEIAITAQLCLTPKGVMPQETAYIEALSDAATYRAMDDRLELDNAACETILVFTLKEELLMDPSALEGIGWQLSSWNGRSPLKDSKITIAFAAGEFSGHAGYRDYTGTYEVSGDDIRFTSTRMKEPTYLNRLKPESLRSQEMEYTTNLSLSTNYRLSEGRLELFTAPGGVLVYAPVPEEKTSGFEAVFVVAGLIAVTYLLRKRE